MSSDSLFAGMKITHSQIRYDRYPLPIKEQGFPEAWPEMNQYFPRYYKPSATLNVFLHNTSRKPLENIELFAGGRPVGEICTRADYAGPIIWYRTNPDIIQPDGRAMIYLRLREVPKEAFKVTVKSGNETATVEIKPADSPAFRISYVGFNREQDKIYVYIQKDTNKGAKARDVFVDGKLIGESCRTLVNADFADDCPSYFEISLDSSICFGKYLEVKVIGENNETAAAQVRALGNQFRIGLLGPIANNAVKLFNMQYNIKYWKASTLPDELWKGLHEHDASFWMPVSSNDGEIYKSIASKIQPEKFIYGTKDEPDAHEPPGLPYMERCGISVMRELESEMILQRRLDPHHPTSLLIDRTYAPQNWFTYGEVTDLPFTDIYVPNEWHGCDFSIIPNTVKILNSAVAPRPVGVKLWVTTNTGHKIRRAPTPEENEIQVHYAIGGGAKNLSCFLDWTSYPKTCEGGYYIGFGKIKPLWNQMGRNNARIVRLSNMLANSFPCSVAKSSNPGELWVSSLMSGKNELLVFAVNRNHNIPATDRLAFPYLYPVENEMVEIKLPSWFKLHKVVEVDWDKVTPLDIKANSGQLKLPVRNLRTAKVFVLSSDSDVEKRLSLDPEKLAALIKSEKDVIEPRAGQKITPKNSPDKMVMLTTEDIIHPVTGEYEIDLRQPQAIEMARQICVTNGEIDLLPGEYLALYPYNIQNESRLELTYAFKSSVPIKNLKVEFYGSHNVGYHSNMQIELIADCNKKPISDTTYKPGWFCGESDRETLSVEEQGPLNEFTVKIYMKDPNIVWAGEYVAKARRLVLSWK